MGELALSIDHIGSTSVPGLGSKNRIDVQVTINGLDETIKTQIDESLARVGFQETQFSRDHRPPGDDSPDSEWQKLFLEVVSGLPFESNIHFRVKGSANQKYALLFRDYLRAHPATAKAYQILKEKLSEYHPHDIIPYVEIKDPVCDIIINAAKEWEKLAEK